MPGCRSACEASTVYRRVFDVTHLREHHFLTGKSVHRRRVSEPRPSAAIVTAITANTSQAMAPSSAAGFVAHASALIAQGWDIDSVSARLGHANITTTQRIYSHAYDADNRSDEPRAKLAALYGNPMETVDRSSASQTGSGGPADAPSLRAIGGRS